MLLSITKRLLAVQRTVVHPEDPHYELISEEELNLGVREDESVSRGNSIIIGTDIIL